MSRRGIQYIPGCPGAFMHENKQGSAGALAQPPLVWDQGAYMPTPPRWLVSSPGCKRGCLEEKKIRDKAETRIIGRARFILSNSAAAFFTFFIFLQWACSWCIQNGIGHCQLHWDTTAVLLNPPRCGAGPQRASFAQI